MTLALPRRFYSLDALRGLAALVVVLSHWKHFFSIPGYEPTPFHWGLHPLNFLLQPLYANGWLAVELFFCLSGFIFFWLYAEKIHRRETSVLEFFIFRFSRLYPLHLLTLLIVLAGQQFVHRQIGAYFIYPQNDLYHFGLQLLFMSNWGFDHGPSFNGPIWSVSVEVFCYAIFFLVCLASWRRWWQLGIIIGAGYVMNRYGHLSIGQGIFSFFIGGITFQIFAWLCQRGFHRKVLPGVVASTGLLWILIPLNAHFDGLNRIYSWAWVWPQHLVFLGKDVVAIGLQELSNHALEIFLFPLTILMLALGEVNRGTLGKRIAFLGDISYSSYLWHFPLQLFFAAAVTMGFIPVAWFSSVWALGVFLLLLLLVSLGSYHFIERPCQSFLRGRLLRRSNSPPYISAHK